MSQSLSKEVDPLPVAASINATASDLQRDFEARMALTNAQPWSLTIVEHTHDADYLRDNLGIDAVSLDEPNWKESIPVGGCVLALDKVQRITGDLVTLGVAECYCAWTPPPYRGAAEFLEDRAQAANYNVGKSDLQELWKLVTDHAHVATADPTNHPDLTWSPAGLEILSLTDLANMPVREFVIDGLCYDDSLVALVGPPKSFKTVMGDDCCVAVADGRTWLGRKVTKPGLVIDAALEGMSGKKARYQAHLGVTRFLDPNDPIHQRLFLLRTVPDITTVAGQDLLLKTIDGICTKTGQPLRLLKLDTLARGMSIAGLDENSTQDMGAYVAGLDRIRREFPSMQLVVHHTEKSGREERGSTALRGACDLMIFSKKEGNTETKAWVRDARDVEVPPPWIVSFAPVTVGAQENGRPITGLRVDTVRVLGEGDVAAGPTTLASDEAVWQVLRSAEGCTRKQIEELCPDYKPNTIWDALNRLMKASPARAVCRGKHPVRYWDAAQAPEDPDHDPGKIRPDDPPDHASEHTAAEDPEIRTAPLKGAGPDLLPDVAGPDRQSRQGEPKPTRPLTSDDWCTPANVLAAARLVLGDIDLDPATNEFAQVRVRARTFFTIEDDGLSKPWRGRVWLNPPYSMPAIESFVRRLVGEIDARNVTAAVLLTNNSTSAAWCQLATERSAAICLPNRRIAFDRPDGSGPQKGNRFAQVIFYFGDDVEQFRRVFEQFGQVLTTHGSRPTTAAPTREVMPLAAAGAAPDAPPVTNAERPPEATSTPDPLATVRVLAEGLMQQHGLVGWTFDFSNAKTGLGLCRHDRRTITISRHHAANDPPESVRDTILHEIAHALCDRREGHGPTWKKTAIALGATPRATADPRDLTSQPHSWKGTCTACGYETTRHRRGDVSCGNCSPSKYDNRYLLVWTRLKGSTS